MGGMCSQPSRVVAPEPVEVVQSAIEKAVSKNPLYCHRLKDAEYFSKVLFNMHVLWLAGRKGVGKTSFVSCELLSAFRQRFASDPELSGYKVEFLHLNFREMDSSDPTSFAVNVFKLCSPLFVDSMCNASRSVSGGISSVVSAQAGYESTRQSQRLLPDFEYFRPLIEIYLRTNQHTILYLFLDEAHVVAYNTLDSHRAFQAQIKSLLTPGSEGYGRVFVVGSGSCRPALECMLRSGFGAFSDIRKAGVLELNRFKGDEGCPLIQKAASYLNMHSTGELVSIFSQCQRNTRIFIEVLKKYQSLVTTTSLSYCMTKYLGDEDYSSAGYRKIWDDSSNEMKRFLYTICMNGPIWRVYGDEWCTERKICLKKGLVRYNMIKSPQGEDCHQHFLISGLRDWIIDSIVDERGQLTLKNSPPGTPHGSSNPSGIATPVAGSSPTLLLPSQMPPSGQWECD